MSLKSLHHTSHITRDAAANAAFYTEVLGLRLVWKTVNFDDPSMYHLAYADREMSGGTIMTFFEEPHVLPGRPGSGSVSETALRVPDRSALEWWADRLEHFDVEHTDVVDRAGRDAILFADPEGLPLALVVETGPDGRGVTWEGSSVAPEFQLGGLDSVTLTVAEAGPTTRTLVELLGFLADGEYGDEDGRGRNVFRLGEGGAGREVHVLERAVARERPGIGATHHVAFWADDVADVADWADRVAAAGLGSSGVIDRTFSHNLYFREPGGILFEIAAEVPGRRPYASDEEVGVKLVLPDHLEPRRAAIEAQLHPIAPRPYAGVR